MIIRRFTDTSGTNKTSFGEAKLDGKSSPVSSVKAKSNGQNILLLSTTDTGVLNITDTDITDVHTEATDKEAFLKEEQMFLTDQQPTLEAAGSNKRNI